MLRIFTPVVLTFWACAAASSAHATACMVMGDRSAIVRSADGDRSPVFMAASCESLRLVSGKAMVSWVTREGKPRLLNLGTLGIDGLPREAADDAVPGAVWSELVSRREVHRAAYTRSLAPAPPERFYVPKTGWVLAAQPGDSLRLTVQKGGKDRVLLEAVATEAGMFRIARALMQPGLVYGLALTQGGVPSFHALKALSSSEQSRLDALYPSLPAGQAGQDAEALVLALWYQQRQLNFNMQTALQGVRLEEQEPTPGTATP